MSRRIAVLVATLGLIMACLAVPSTALAGDPCFHSEYRPAPTTGSTVDIAIADCVFLPTVAHVPVGATVEWRNTSGQAHEVVGANLTWGAHEKLLQNGDTIGWEFDEPGVYAYTCMLHPGMSGAIVVGAVAAAGAAPAAAGEAPAAAVEPPIVADPGPPIAAVGALAAAALAAIVAVALLVRRRGAGEGTRSGTGDAPTVYEG
jgi:plastocyanin